MRKFNGTYYFIYSSLNSHELCYAVSDHPTGGFQYGGILVSNGDIGLPGVNDVNHAKNSTGNTHGSLIEINGKYYVFITDTATVSSLPDRHVQRKSSLKMENSVRLR